MKQILRYIPIILLLLALISFFAFGGGKYINPSNWGKDFIAIENYVRLHPIMSCISFVIIYSFCCAIAMPSVLWLTLSSGILFGGLLGGLLSGIGASIGASILFWASAQAFGGKVKTNDGSIVNKFEKYFHKHEFSNLLALRLIPISPFFLVTIAASAFKVKYSKFLLATFLGIVPVELAFSFIGHGIRKEILSGKPLNFESLLTPNFTIPLGILFILAMSPNFIEFIKTKVLKAS